MDLPEYVNRYIKELQDVNYTISDVVTGVKEIDKTLYIVNELIRVYSDTHVMGCLGSSSYITLPDILDSFVSLSDFPQISANFITSQNVQGIIFISPLPMHCF